jgi:hypothetical protein
MVDIRHILLHEAIAYLTDGWHVKPYPQGYKAGYAMAWREVADGQG